MALITDEGNVKLKGFTVGDAIRVHAQRDSVTAKEQANYRISGSQIKEDFDCADVFACGAILFQLLTGEIFKSQTGEPGNVIANATLAETGESIPLPIANILYASLDPDFNNAYPQVLSMNEALEKLLQDGPFTVVAFDLAFFMHQLFREEVDVLSSKQQAEKGKNIKTLRAEPTLEPVSFASQPVPPAMAEASVDRPREKPFKRKKPNPFLFFGAAAAVVAIMVGVYFGLQRKETDPDRFDQERARLLQKAAYLSSDGLRAQQEELERQASVLRKQLRQQARMENDRKKQELEDEMIQLSDEISRIGILAEQRRRLEERERKAEQERLRLEAEAQAAKEAAIAARERQARQERERQRTQRQAEEVAAAAAAKEAEEPEPVIKTIPPVVAPVQELQPEQPATIARVGESGVTAPVFEKRFPPHYPRKAYRIKLEGYVLLDAVLNSDGTIDDIKVLRGLGKGKLGFEEEAIKAVKTWQYQPGQVNGAPSNVRMTLKVDFKLQ